MAGPEKTDAEIQARVGDRTSMDIFMDVARAAAQGATLGFSDELYGLYSEFFADKDYDTAVQEIRQGLEEFRELNPTAAYGAEILGSMVTGGAGAARGIGAAVGREAVKRAAGIGALEAGIYGAGTGETMEDRARQAMLSAPIGAVSGAAGEALLPKISAAAAEALKKGYKLSPGQRLGEGISKFEQAMTTQPFVGSMVQKTMERPAAQFRRKVVEEALGPYASKLPPGISGNQLVEEADLVVSEAYQDIVPQLSIASRPFALGAKRVLGAAKKNKELDEVDLAKIEKIIAGTVKRRLEKDGRLTGNALKKAESELTTEIRKQFMPSGDSNIGRALRDVRDVLRQQITIQNPDVPELQTVNRAFASLKPITKAKDAAVGAMGEFTPTQYLRQVKDMPPSTPGKAMAREIQPLVRQTLPSSGTAERAAVQRLIEEPGPSIMGMAKYIPTALTYGTGEPGRIVATRMYQAPGGLLRAGAPAIGEYGAGLPEIASGPPNIMPQSLLGPAYP